jgi:hypothetical protein
MYCKYQIEEDSMSAQMEETLELLKDDAAASAEAAMVLSALEAAGGREDRRQLPRMIYRTTAMLWLFADTPGSAGRALYTRDINERGIGFVTRDRLPLGYGGVVRLPNPKMPSQILSIACTLYRCRLAAPGWYEGALHFNRDQHEFLPPGSENERGKGSQMTD